MSSVVRRRPTGTKLGDVALTTLDGLPVHGSSERTNCGAPGQSDRPVIDRYDAGKVVEGVSVCAQDRATGRRGGGSDDEIVCAAGSARAADGDEQVRVLERHGFVVGQDRDRGDDLVDEGLAAWPLTGRCELNADSEFSHGDGGDRDIVVIVDQLVEQVGVSFGVDEERGVE